MTRTDTLSARVRDRLKHELYHRRISQRQAGQWLEQHTGEEWSQSRVGKTLNGVVGLQVDVLGMLSDLIGLSPVDLVREPGRELVADLTPSELQLLERIRAKPHLVPALLQILSETPKRTTARPLVRTRVGQEPIPR